MLKEPVLKSNGQTIRDFIKHTLYKTSIKPLKILKECKLEDHFYNCY